MMQYVLSILKFQYLEVIIVYFCQDNVGCYYCVSIVFFCVFIEQFIGIKVVCFDFSDFQGGKGFCDRLVVICKLYICVYINEGYDVMNVEDMKIVLFFYGGVIGV